MLELLEISGGLLALILLAGFLTAILHGATGMAGGIVMTAVLSWVIGPKEAIPAMTVALAISHSSRAILNRHSIDVSLASQVILYAVPGIILGAFLFTQLSEAIIALVMAVFLFSSFPIKRRSKAKNYSIGKRGLAVGSSIWGFLAGNVVGPGFVLAPFLLASGMNRHRFVATLAAIVLIMNITKLVVFSLSGLLNTPLLLLGVLIGLATIPGNYVGRTILRRMTDHNHGRLIDIMTVIVIANFLYIAVTESRFV